jgi:sugar lactone lactonase YvrE
MRRVALSVSFAFVVALVSSCGGGSSSNNGTLTVNITAAPATASVTVNGPGGYTKALTATGTLTGLAPGSYTVSAAPSRVAGAVVSTVYDVEVTGSPATVSKGATATAGVAYALRGGTGRLWVTDIGRAEVQGYGPGQLAVSGSPVPEVTIGTGAHTDPCGIAVGPGGSLWVALPGSGSTHQIARYDPSQLGTSGTPTPAATLDTGSDTARRLAFDAAGNLWVGFSVSSGAPSVARYDAADLAGTGALPATRSLTWVLPSAGAGAKHYFDRSGNLWILNSGGFGHPAALLRADASMLGATGTPSFLPAATITSDHVFFAQGAAFDGDGALWIAVMNPMGAIPATDLVRYAESQLAVDGPRAVDPEAILTVSGPTTPTSVAFDEAGDLWVLDLTARTVSHFERDGIIGLGNSTIAPDIVINTPGGAVEGIVGLAFDPTPPVLPMQ